MAKIQLTLSPHYVNSWGTLEGLRELMQNCIDRSHESPDSGIILNYDPMNERLKIGNHNSSLNKKTLLLGETSKANNRKAIGQYGEGYKLALLVLLRDRVEILIDNSNEHWRPYFTRSRIFDSDVLTIETKKQIDSHNLVFILDGISPEVYNEFQNKCLHFHPNIKTIDTPFGSILLEEKYRKQIFCEGLFICEMSDNLAYGYNMKSENCKLDRDRRKLVSFNLLWEVGRMYASLKLEEADRIHKLIQQKSADIEYFDSHSSADGELYKAVCDSEYKVFLRKHGKLAVFVEDQDQAQYIKEKFNDRIPVIVPEVKYKYLSCSPTYQDAAKLSDVQKEATPYFLIEDFLLKNKSKIFGSVKKLIKEELLPMSLDWKIRK